MLTAKHLCWVGLLVCSGAMISGCRTGGASQGDAAAAYRPRVAVQLYVWTQDRGRRNVKPAEDLDAIFAEARAAGFNAVEGMLSWFDSAVAAARIEALLRKHDLRMVGVYSGGVFLDEQEGQKTIQSILDHVRLVQNCGLEFVDINPNPLPEKTAKTPQQLAIQADMLNRLGRQLHERGLKLLIHHHDAEIMHGATEYRYLLTHLDPAVAGLCVDTNWIYRGGADPLTLLKESGNLARALHLRNSVDGVWSESFGPGDIDYRPIAEHLRRINFDGWLILELAHESKTAITRPLSENARIGREYLESIFLRAQ